MNPFPRDVPAISDERPFFSFQSPHAAGAGFLFADGSARMLSESIDQRVYKSLSTIAGNEEFTE
jgi:prepilin-type processing-associated H-X9-DG protein